MKSKVLVNVATCRLGANLYDLSRDRVYIIKGEWRDLIDKDEYVVLNNDCGGEVSVRKSRFKDFRIISYKKYLKETGK